MTFLIFAILFSTFNHLLFKAYARFQIDLLSVIVVNYAVCIVIAFASSVESIFQNSFFLQAWYPFSIIQGILLVSCLYLLGRTTKKHGVAVASLATRISVAIPTIAAFFLYDDSVKLLKITGILATILALYLSCFNQNRSKNSIGSIGILPLSLFLVFGAHFVLIKFVQERYLDNSSYQVYVLFAFLSAFIISGSTLLWKLFKRQQICRIKDLVSGLALGFTNYGAIYFLLRVLSVPDWQSSQLFPTISIAVVGLSSFGAWLIFKERLVWRMTGALTIGAISIILINT